MHFPERLKDTPFKLWQYLKTWNKNLVKMCIKKSLAPSEIILTHCSPHTGQRYELSSFRAEIELEKKVFWQLGDKWSFDDAQWHRRYTSVI